MNKKEAQKLIAKWEQEDEEEYQKTGFRRPSDAIPKLEDMIDKKKKGLCGMPFSAFDDKTLLDVLLEISTELGKRMDKNNPFRLKAKILVEAEKADGNLDPYKEDWEKLDELLGKEGYGGYYDLLELLKQYAELWYKDKFGQELSSKLDINDIKTLHRATNLLHAISLIKVKE